MNSMKEVSGFSKLNKRDKISWLAKNFLYHNPLDVAKQFASFWHDEVEKQKLFDGFSENTLTNFYLPFGVAPNFLINDKIYCVPMVTEESSVVAASSKAAKFWLNRGGFKAKVISSVKIGQVHFSFNGDHRKLNTFFKRKKDVFFDGIKHLTANMEKRGGGVRDIQLLDFSHLEENYYQLKVSFETCDSMGANFINSILEQLALILREEASKYESFTGKEKDIEVIMSILSNYTPDCVVECEVSCPVEELHENSHQMLPDDFARRFVKAVNIANFDVHRATTHNKGILNGIDAVVIATGNDFRAVEACVHTYAAMSGTYKSLTIAEVTDGIFKFKIRVPLALGTVGGLTNLHPMAKTSLDILGNPSAAELMMVTAATGLAQNFGAIRSLVTTGIQYGHMKMHLSNILAQLKASEEEVIKVQEYFVDKIVSFSAVREFLELIRTKSYKV
ncbi:MAG: hydroxymethylglutaryl-CoA reductase, degradative [Chitinophagales bacterium]|nr:hydroxymethylglutaryl-CoA reductase, degradative [Chitinophagales bacterium]